MQRYVSYLRVSTQQQGRSGLGIEAQRKVVFDYTGGGDWELIEEFVETESGRNSDRLSLEQALISCRIHSAVLVVAKVDRLTRSSAFLHQLLDSGVELAFCDLPVISGPTGKFLLNQMAAVAELEAAMISQRTKAALAAAKDRGIRLGTAGNATHEGRLLGQKMSLRRRRYDAESRRRDLSPLFDMLLLERGLSFNAAAKELNRVGIPTARGKQWTATQVSRMVVP